MAKVDLSKISKEDQDRAMQLLEREKEYKRKVKEGIIKPKTWADMSPEQKDKAKKAEKVRQAKVKITLKKAQDAGITVTDKEVEDFLAS